MKEILVILGNGFDLALGMNTSYKNFYQNKEFWPFGKKNNSDMTIRYMKGLDTFLDDNMQENWYNLENLLADYATNIKTVSPEQVEHDLQCFKKLKSSLSSFIDKEQRSLNRIYSSTKAVKFLDAIFENRRPIIYTFNYTALDIIAEMLEHKDISYTAVHGSILGKDIVLGLEDNLDIPREYDFLKKVSEPTYESSNLFYDLIKAKEVVFFGHSLGKNDYHFFRQFFKIHSDESNINPENKCKITFFTANSNSRMDILANLRAMNEGKNNQLFAQNDLRFIRTLDEDRKAREGFDKWIDDLKIK